MKVVSGHGTNPVAMARTLANIDQDRLAGRLHKRDVARRGHDICGNSDGSFDVGLACIAREEACGNCEMSIAQYRN